MRRVAEEWLEKANRDLAAARLLAEHETLWEGACFHCQQAAEKALKAFLIAVSERLPRTHDLVVLTHLCGAKDPSFEKLIDSAELLNPFYAGTRYPNIGGLELTEEDVDRAVSAAKQVYDFVSRKIHKGQHAPQ
jgi:HEPN domain-containing protein